ncbi:hypothetical protein RUM43_006162 [Polyplax serrata]|uniref:Uncharacterized protein n=1 Tax=Polyplax serrata TaxID=468196 RepID=A0AAN8NSQ1_POLSC
MRNQNKTENSHPYDLEAPDAVHSTPAGCKSNHVDKLPHALTCLLYPPGNIPQVPEPTVEIEVSATGENLRQVGVKVADDTYEGEYKRVTYRRVNLVGITEGDRLLCCRSLSDHNSSPPFLLRLRCSTNSPRQVKLSRRDARQGKLVSGTCSIKGKEKRFTPSETVVDVSPSVTLHHPKSNTH